MADQERDAQPEVIDGELVDTDPESQSPAAAEADADVTDAEVEDPAPPARNPQPAETGGIAAAPVPESGGGQLPAPDLPGPGPANPAFPGSSVPAPTFDYTDDGVPTLDYVRNKIEGRLGTAQGSAELAGADEAARHAADQAAEREKLAKDKLEEIRRSLGR